MTEVFICDAVRTPFGRYGGALSSIRTDDLATLPIKALIERNPSVDWGSLDDVIYGCVNQAGEDNRNVARMALLLAGLPETVPGATVNRLCGSSLDAVGTASRAIKCGETQFMIAGGVESMSRAPFVIPKADSAFSRAAKIEDTTIGWRFVNPLMKSKYGIDSMPETAENVAEEFKVGRAEQDALALRSQQRWAAAQSKGFYRGEIIPVSVPGKKGAATLVDRDEHPRPDTTLEALARLKGVVKPEGTVTRECVGRERRRLRDDSRFRCRRKKAQTDSEGAHPWHGHRRRRAAHHGRGSGAGHAQSPGEDGAEARADGRDRA